MDRGHGGPMQFVLPGDVDLFRALNLAGTDIWLDLFMVLMSTLALPYILALLAFPLWWRGRHGEAFDLLVLLALTIFLTEVLKFAFDRPRPCDALGNVRLLTSNLCATESDPAFPSGHTSRAFALATLLALRHPWPTRAGGVAFAVLVGVSRIYLGVHWPSDVFAGALVGIAMGLVLERVLVHETTYRRVREPVVRRIEQLFRSKKAPRS